MCARAPISRVHCMNYSFIWKPIFKQNLWYAQIFPVLSSSFSLSIFRKTSNVIYTITFEKYCISRWTRKGGILNLICNERAHIRNSSTIILDHFLSFDFRVLNDLVEWYLQPGSRNSNCKCWHQKKKTRKYERKLCVRTNVMHKLDFSFTVKQICALRNNVDRFICNFTASIKNEPFN